MAGGCEPVSFEIQKQSLRSMRGTRAGLTEYGHRQDSMCDDGTKQKRLNNLSSYVSNDMVYINLVE